jgi:hypothetical protein
MDNLIDFLRARCDEDEAVSARASGSEWDVIVPEQPFVVFDVQAYRGRKTQTTVGAVASVARVEDRVHIARHDPARVLAEVEAKRLVIREWESAKRTAEEDPGDVSAQVAMLALEIAMRAQATVYEQHPDYRPEWALDT